MFFINFAFDITRDCDCISTKNDKMICEDIGIIASKDIVSVDKATSDLINKDEDLFLKQDLSGVYSKMLEYARDKGIGNLEYNLIRL